MDVRGVRIQRRENVKDKPFSEVFVTFACDGVETIAYSRLWYPLDDTPHARAAQAEAFRTRAKNWPVPPDSSSARAAPGGLRLV